ncbi:DJ-1 family glyoxalase III [Terrisporobacter vanillatitrophus]|uniref:DJ-1 family glyoxalase III n=1 Tax=Terrisporobacter vanillatitrophus TaxID=3058402 RepID=UPI003369A9E4
MKKVLVLLADGFEEIEALSVVDVLRRGNIDCKMCSIKDEYVKGTHNIVVQSDCNIKDIDSNDYDAVVLPGGLPGAENLKANCVKELITNMNKNKKIVAAICAAPETLEYFNVLEGKKCTSYPGFIQDKEKVNYVEDEAVVIDDNIITSRGPATALTFALTILEELGCINEMEDIKEGMLVNFYNKFAK